MPIKRVPPYRTIIRNLLSSGKLTRGEQTLFERLQAELAAGATLDDRHKLWIETLKDKHLAK